MQSTKVNRSLQTEDGNTSLPLLERLKSKESFSGEIFLLLTCGVGIFAALSILSHNPLDPSPMQAIYPPTNQPPTNWGGSIGASLSGLAFYYLGLGAYGLPLVGWLASVGALMPSVSRFVARFAGGLLLFIIAVGTLGYGAHGGTIGSSLSQVLDAHLGRMGGVLTLFTLGLVAILLIVQRAILFGLAQIWGSVSHGWWLRQRKRSEASPRTTLGGASVLDLPAAAEPEIESVLTAMGQEIATYPADSTPDRSWAHEQPYSLPSIDLFRNEGDLTGSPTDDELREMARRLTQTLSDFGVPGAIVSYEPGPVVTVFEFELDPGVKQARVTSLVDDLALALRVDSIIVLPVKGKSALGIQVPNRRRQTVLMGAVLKSEAFRSSRSPLTFALGKSLNGQPVVADLTTMPHLLIAGATGSGKSVAINSLLCSVIMKGSPREVRMILVDPKMLELSVYEGIPHLLMPVITDPVRSALALQWATAEMERRYRLMQHLKVRHIDAFNAAWTRMDPLARQEIVDGLDIAKDRNQTTDPLPYLLIVIDELADLMLTAPKDVEASIQRLAQKARAAGIHLVLATQRPSVDIITGVIKANLPYRIAFQVVSRHDSRTILDQGGADSLLGRGDMLLMRPGLSRLERIQGSFISDDEVNGVVSEVCRLNGAPQYDASTIGWIDREVSRREGRFDDTDPALGDNHEDLHIHQAIAIAREQGSLSASYLQRQLKIGYNRAARIVETLESRGLLSRQDGARPRQWLGESTIE